MGVQGAIGKFGAVELSDISAFAELPDGQVVSSSDSGDMLLWDAGVVKVWWPRSGSCMQ